MIMESPSLSSSSERETIRQRFRVPKGYTLVKGLGCGSYGTVLECVKNDTGEHVAIKVPERNNLDREAEILEKLKSHNSDESNIVEYKGEVFVKNTRLLVLEKLDITLRDYVRDLRRLMRLEHIRTVIQQLATALNTMQSAGIIHTDVKMDNIMMVDHVKQPFKVKLIDFGMAKYKSEANAGKLLQVLAYRAPEIILGLPYSEAIDVWSLGCVMARMVARIVLFGSNSEYSVLRQMIHLLGLPPQHLIEAGQRSKNFFKKMSNGLWRLKTSIEYFKTCFTYNPSSHSFRSLDEMKTMYCEMDNPAEAAERRECIELLKAMLRWDEKDRITPSGILNHPFITKSYLNSSSHISTCSEPELSTSLFIMVKPADPKNRINLAGLPDEDSDLEDKESSEYVDIEDSSDYIDAEHIDTDKGNEDSQDRKNNEVNEKPVNKEINEDSENSDTYEDIDGNEDRKNNEDNEKPLNKEISEYEVSDDTDSDEDTDEDSDEETDEDSDEDSDEDPDEDSEKEQSKKEKNCFQRVFSWIKKKNCFQSIFSWMKKKNCFQRVLSCMKLC